MDEASNNEYTVEKRHSGANKNSAQLNQINEDESEESEENMNNKVEFQFNTIEMVRQASQKMTNMLKSINS